MSKTQLARRQKNRKKHGVRPMGEQRKLRGRATKVRQRSGEDCITKNQKPVNKARSEQISSAAAANFICFYDVPYC